MSLPTRLLLALTLFGSGLSVRADLNVDVDVQTSPTPKVTINWNSQGTTPVYVKRRLLGETGVASWSTIATYPDDGSPPFIDTSVTSGQTYEYSVDSVVSTSAYGSDNRIALFVATIDQPLLNEDRGAVLLVVEDTWANELQFELNKLELSLAGDGWEVIRMDWAREGVGDAEALKAAIQTAVTSNPDINSLLLFGALPMVKSGYIAPDGHAAHPHETDLFYADLDNWNDTLNNTNHTPGDGQYDHDYFPSEIELATGRVTFHGMDAFKKTEVEYLRDYLHKEHAYRYRHRDVSYRNFVGDDFYLFGTNTVLKAMVGNGNWTSSGSLDSLIGASNYLFGFGQRNGDWSPARDTFQKAIFTACFRSHVQEFWSDNNKMRGMLAQPDWGLTAVWGGRPSWFFHKMAAGLPIGESVLSTQNDYLNPQFQYNSSLGTYVQSREYSFNSMESGTAYPWVSTNLMGDPTLRISHVEPVSQLTITRTNSSTVNLSWTASPATDLIGYHVYKSSSRLGPYTRLTTTPITGTSYNASASSSANAWFQVRAIAKVTVPTGVYQDQSHGQFAKCYSDGSVNTPPTSSNLTVTGKVNTPLYFQFPGSDINGQTLTPIVVDNPDSGQIRWYQGQPYYVSKRDTPGTDTATYVMFDGVTVSNPATVTFITDTAGDTLLAWELPDNSTANQAPTFTASNISSIAISGGPGTDIVSPFPYADAYMSRNIGSSLDPNSDYFTWTVTPGSGYSMNIDRLNMGICGASGDDISFELRVSDDGFATHAVVPMNVSTIQGRGHEGNQGLLVSADASGVAILQNQDQAVEFRMHFWHTGSSSAALGFGKITDPVYYDAIEDVSIIGNVSASQSAPANIAHSTYTLSPEDGWVNINSLTNGFANPVVLANVTMSASQPPAVVMARPVSGSTDQYQLKIKQPAVSGTQNPAEDYLVTVLVVEAGVSAQWEAGFFSSSVTDYKTSWNGELVNLSNNYSMPVIFGQVIVPAGTDPNWSVFWTAKNNNGTVDNFNPATGNKAFMGKHVGEDSSKTRPNATLGYLVVEANTLIDIAGQELYAMMTPDVVEIIDAVNGPVALDTSASGFSAISAAISGLSEMDGQDGGWAVLVSPDAISGSLVSVAVDEDEISDADGGHASETVGVLILEGVAAPVQSTYGNNGNPWSIGPGTIRIEAENYDQGGQDIAYNDSNSSNQGGAYRTNEGVDVSSTSDTGGGYNVGWTANGEWLEYTVDVEPGLYDVNLRVASGGSTVGDVLLLLGDGSTFQTYGSYDVTNTGGWQSWQTLTIPNVSLNGSETILSLELVGANININWIEFVKASNNDNPSTYGNNGNPWSIGSGVTRIEAENFDQGGQGIAYNDSASINEGGAYRTSEGVDISTTSDAGGGYNVGWAENGEWMEYTVDIQPGIYDIHLRVASNSASAGDVEVNLGDGTTFQSLGIFNVDSTGGWQSWETLTLTNVAVSGDESVLRLDLLGKSVNINWIEFEKADNNDNPSTYGNNGNPWGIGSGTTRIEVENFDQGGEGVAYHDSASANLGGQYRPTEGVDIGNASDTGGGYSIGWVTNGEWLEYTVDIEPGSYDIKLRIASYSGSPGDVVVKLGDGETFQTLGTFDTYNTGGWNNWATMTMPNVTVSGSEVVLRLEMVGGSTNLNWIEFTKN